MTTRRLRCNPLPTLKILPLALSLLLVANGCMFEITDPNNPPPGNEGPAPVPGDFVTVRFANLTDNEAVDVEFFATSEALAQMPDDLFAEAYRVTASVGVAGTGIIQPRNGDIIEFPCTETLSLGTMGGRFLDNESGEFRGQGTPRWVQEGPLALCGGEVTLVFNGGGDSFFTAINVRGE